MKKVLIIIVLAIIGGLFVMKNNDKQIPLRDFFKNPETSSYAISPDGKIISYLAPYKNRMNIHIIKDGKVKRLTHITDRNISSYFWKEDSIVFSRDFGGDENFQLFSIDLKTNKITELTPFPGVRTIMIDDLEDIHPEEMLIGLNKRNPEVFDIYRLNIKTGELKLVYENPGNITSFLTDHNGLLRIASSSDGLNTTMFYRDKEEEEFKPVITTNYKDTFDPLFFTFDNKNLYVESNLGRDKTAIIEYDIKNKKEINVLFSNDEVDVSGLNYSKKRKKLTTITYYTWKSNRVFLDKLIESVFKNIENKLNEDLEISITSYNKEEDVFIVFTYSDKKTGTYYKYDLKSDTLEKIADIIPWLDSKKLASIKPIKYTSRDGLTIHGYLTLPINKESGKIPIVVHPHGGPWARDTWGYNPTVQFLANRGYGVLQVNFRSSTGYGKSFLQAGFKQWGLKMQDDITDGVNWLINEGIADPNKIAIYGGSYGGYAVLAGLAFTPDLYACGVDYVGVSNIFTLFKSVPPYWKPELEKMYEMVGHPENDKELLEKISPVFHVDKIKAPLFVAQGAKDPRVNINESNQIVEALDKRGIKVPYLVKEDEGHGFRNEENRIEFYEKMEQFLKDCL